MLKNLEFSLKEGDPRFLLRRKPHPVAAKQRRASRRLGLVVGIVATTENIFIFIKE